MPALPQGCRGLGFAGHDRFRFGAFGLEGDPQKTVVELRLRDLAASEGVGKNEGTAVGTDLHVQLVTVAEHLEVGLFDERHLHLHDHLAAHLLDPEGAVGDEAGDRIEVAVELAGHEPQPIQPDHLVVEQPQPQPGNVGKRGVDGVEVPFLNGPPAIEVRVGDDVGQDPVDDDPVDPVAEQTRDR